MLVLLLLVVLQRDYFMDDLYGWITVAPVEGKLSTWTDGAAIWYGEPGCLSAGMIGLTSVCESIGIAAPTGLEAK